MADRNPVAEGMKWVNVYLCVADPAKALEFYSKAFGLVENMKLANDDGVIEHAEMKYKDHIIMMGPESTMQNYQTPKNLGATHGGLYLYCDDVDAMFKQAKAAGAKVVEELNDKFWGDRVFQVEDHDGHRWTFAQNVKDMELPG